MDQQLPSLFEIRLSDKGVYHIMRFAKLARWVLAIVLFESVLLIGMEVLYRMTFSVAPPGMSKVAIALDLVYPYYLGFYIVFAILQTSYYLSFSRRLAAGVTARDEVVFNSAFKSLYLNAITGLILVIGSIMVSGLRCYTYIEFYIGKK